MEENERTPIFTNRYSPNGETARQIYFKLRFLPWILVLLLGTAFLGMIAYWFVWLLRGAKEAGIPAYSQSLFWICLAAFAIWIYLIVREIFAPRTFAKRQMRRIKEAYGTDRIEIRAAFCDDTVAFHNAASNADVQYAYSAFGMLTETKDLFLVRTHEKQLIALDKSGFTGIDAAGFRAFMDEKCPNAKRRWSAGA